MAATTANRSRFRYALAVLVVIGAGLGSRSFPGLLPEFMGKYPGDACWALMIFLGWGVVFPGISTAMLAAYAMATCGLVELSQLYRAPWIDGIRSTTLGHLVLGSGFAWGDLVAYGIGVGVGGLGESVMRSTIATHSNLTSAR